MEIKIGGKTRFENLLKKIIPFALVGYEVIITIIVGYFITSYPTRAHGIIVKNLSKYHVVFAVMICVPEFGFFARFHLYLFYSSGKKSFNSSLN